MLLQPELKIRGTDILVRLLAGRKLSPRLQSVSCMVTRLVACANLRGTCGSSWTGEGRRRRGVGGVSCLLPALLSKVSQEGMSRRKVTSVQE